MSSASERGLRELGRRARIHYKSELRAARAEALADAEGYPAIFFALERLARYRKPGISNLGHARVPLCSLAEASALAVDLPSTWPAFHRPFPNLFETVRDARNSVMHVGARARHLTTHAVDVCLVLEDAMQNGLDRVSDFMVVDIVSVETWQPVSWARQRMLESAFTYLPIRPDGRDGLEGWRMVADWQLARFLADSENRFKSLSLTLGDAIKEGLKVAKIAHVEADTKLDEIIDQLGSAPLLVSSGDRIVGLVTAFDLL